jgi:preprotein translocase, SecE subunit, bacterial
MEFAPKEWWQKSREFWREMKSEMKKVSWPGKNEVVSTTGVVLVATIFFGVYLWICDVVFYKLIDLLFTQFGSGV